MGKMTAEAIRAKFPYLYETHLHTSQGSKCGRCSGKEMAGACKEAGYTGIFVTDHSWGGNTNVDRRLGWTEWVDRFSEGFEDARRYGSRIGLDVYFGWEACYRGTEFLIFGLTPEWLKKHPQMKAATIEEQYRMVKANGGMVVQAHPFREEDYIPEIRLFPEYVDGVEGINATHTHPQSMYHRSTEYDSRAIAYASQHGLLLTAGSDIHQSTMFGGGMAFARRFSDAADFVTAVLRGEEYVLTNGIDWFTKAGQRLTDEKREDI